MPSGRQGPPLGGENSRPQKTTWGGVGRSKKKGKRGWGGGCGGGGVGDLPRVFEGGREGCCKNGRIAKKQQTKKEGERQGLSSRGADGSMTEKGQPVRRKKELFSGGAERKTKKGPRKRLTTNSVSLGGKPRVTQSKGRSAVSRGGRVEDETKGKDIRGGDTASIRENCQGGEATGCRRARFGRGEGIVNGGGRSPTVQP